MILTSELITGRKISLFQWEKFFVSLFRGRQSARDVKSALLLLAKKGEETPEISGCVRAVQRLEGVRTLALPHLIDVCGTGGDGKKTFNISTVSAFVIAGGGGYVAKHGNRAISSQAGSSDLMSALGIKIELPFPRMVAALKKFHLGYFHAPFYHPSFAGVQNLRREWGVRTLFNALGPLLNPFRLSHQMIGVGNAQWLNPVAETLAGLNRKRAVVCRSEDGLDELSTSSPSQIFYIEGKRIRQSRFDPRLYKFKKARPRDLEGGDLQANRAIALGILEGRLTGPAQEVVLLNSGMAFWLLGQAKSIQEGIERSRWSLRTRRALSVLEGLRRL